MPDADKWVCRLNALAREMDEACNTARKEQLREKWRKLAREGPGEGEPWIIKRFSNLSG